MSVGIRLRLLGAAVTAACLLAPAAASADIPGEILFENESGGIWTVEPDGSDEAQIRATGYGPRFSPDGMQIAFVDDKGAGADEAIWVMNADGSSAHSVSPANDGFFSGALSWSPDGGAIVFARDDSLWKVPTAGGGETELTNSASDIHDFPLFSEDGSKIAFQDEDDFSIGVMAASGGSVNNNLTSPTIDQVDIPNDVAEDGKILYTRVDSSGPTDTAQLRLVGFDGSGDTLLAVAPSNDELAGYRFSPDGTELVWDDEGVSDDLRTGAPGLPGTALGLTQTPAFPDWAVPETKIIVNDNGDDPDADTGDDLCDADAATAGRQCTLRAAIETANANDGEDEIEFDVDPAGRVKISPASALPQITEKVSIDASTQPGAPEDEPGVELDGTAAGDANGLYLGPGSSDSTIRGFDIHGFQKTGIVAGGSGGHTLEGNWIGFKPDSTFGEASIDGNGSGIDVRAADVTIGGNTPEQRNIISANGNHAGLQLLEDLDGSDKTQASLHDTFTNAGSGIVISDDDSSNVEITGNWIGPDPDGGRFGYSFGITSTVGVFVGPDAGSGASGILSNIKIGGTATKPGTGAGNVISGNVMGILAAPETKTAGVVSGLRVKGNLIGADPDGESAENLGGAIGFSSLNFVTAEVGGPGGQANSIQGQIFGVLGGGATGLKVQNNLIGVDDDLQDLASGLSGPAPDLGLHNLFGVVLGDTDGALVGGSAAALGNRVLGNLIGVGVGGEQSKNNAVLANTIGSATGIEGNAADATYEDLGGLFGILSAGTNNDIGDPGAGNKIQGNGFGVFDIGSSGGHLQANDVNGNLFGYFGAQISDRSFGGSSPGAGNAFTTNLIGMVMVGWSPTEEELEALRAGDDNPVTEEDRDRPFEAPVSQGPLALYEATTTVEAGESEQAVALGDPPGGGTAARGSGGGESRESRGPGGSASSLAPPSSGSEIVGNSFGTTVGGAEAPNFVGAWLIGTHNDYEITNNTIAHNNAGGLALGNPVAAGSGVPEPQRIKLQSNRIFDNYFVGQNLEGVPALGFDLLEPKPKEIFEQSFGVTANDLGDADTGANGRQNFPLISSAERQKNGAVVVSGTLNSKASKAYKVELFANGRCNAFGAGEGELPLGGGPFQVSTNAGGNASFTRTVSLPNGAATKITANATGAEGTSEFSPCAETTDAPDQPGPPDEPDPSTPSNPPDHDDPSGKASGKGKNKAGKPTKVTVKSDEDGTVTATGTQKSTGSGHKKRLGAGAAVVILAKPHKGNGGHGGHKGHHGHKGQHKNKKIKVKLGKVKKHVKAHKRTTLKLKPKGHKAKKAAKKLKHAVHKGSKAKAKLKVVFKDEAGNKSKKKLTLKLK